MTTTSHFGASNLLYTGLSDSVRTRKKDLRRKGRMMKLVLRPQSLGSPSESRLENIILGLLELTSCRFRPLKETREM